MPMRCSRTLSKAAALLFSLSVAGCSTFEVYDHYRPADQDFIYVTPGNGLVRLSVAFPRDFAFYSIGLIGLPVIPVGPFHFRHRKDTEIQLWVSAELDNEIDLSIASNPCIRTGSDETICPTRLKLHAGASVQDDGSMHADGRPRWHGFGFCDSPTNDFEIDPRRATGPITLDGIYRLCGYEGTPKWRNLTISLEYLYPCGNACPEAFTMDTAGLLSVAGRPMLDGPTTFRMTRDHKYEFMTNVQ